MSFKKIMDMPFKHVLYIFIPLLAFLLLFELGSCAVNKLTSKTKVYKYNRVLSGYMVSKNSPDFTFKHTIKLNPDEPDAKTDKNGFMTAVEINEEKPEGVIRIFFLGGSALLGAGQTKGDNWTYQLIKDYPQGVYSFPLSIPGQVEKMLTEKYPGRKFEIANTSVYNRKFHQSYMHYISALSRFRPDIIVNMDGFNDITVFSSGTPFADAENEELDRLMSLWANVYIPAQKKGIIESTSTYKLLMDIRDMVKGPFSNSGSNKKRLKDLLDTNANDPAQIDFSVLGPRKSYDKDEYLKRKALYVKNTERFFYVLDNYMAMLKRDGVKLLFAIQPILDRKVNKRFSAIEQAMHESHFYHYNRGEESSLYIPMYFFDDHLSGAIKEKVVENGYSLVDINQEIKELGADFELYTDYCHLTPRGNEEVARILADNLAPIIESLD